MKKLSDIDKNFKIETGLNKEDIVFYDIKEAPFCTYGLLYDGSYYRMPHEIGQNLNEFVKEMYTNTAGGRVRFVTDSPYIAISVKMSQRMTYSNLIGSGHSGFDLYADGYFAYTYAPPEVFDEGYEGLKEFGESKTREILINFPSYNNVRELYVGVKQGSLLKEAPQYPVKGKVVYYGSSITQGACTTRPGNSYPFMVSQITECDYLNLGFSGGARGEVTMARYIASLDPTVFVMDYDHNAPTPEHLERTHEPFFKTFRNLCPHTPVVMVTAPNLRFGTVSWIKQWLDRREIIRRTYENALAAGDRNVSFIDGETLWDGVGWDACTFDGCHPNDMGHFRMAQRIAPLIKSILEQRMHKRL